MKIEIVYRHRDLDSIPWRVSKYLETWMAWQFRCSNSWQVFLSEHQRHTGHTIYSVHPRPVASKKQTRSTLIYLVVPLPESGQYNTDSWNKKIIIITTETLSLCDTSYWGDIIIADQTKQSINTKWRKFCEDIIIADQITQRINTMWHKFCENIIIADQTTQSTNTMWHKFCEDSIIADQTTHSINNEWSIQVLWRYNYRGATAHLSPGLKTTFQKSLKPENYLPNFAKPENHFRHLYLASVSYTHLTLPTTAEV